ncbi:MAG: PhnA domain-containing protein [Mariprofundaceae bacterium]|nr:PhnA domain-containing protein [Mariprofundaceae bacterium]
MGIEQALQARSESKCELCAATEKLAVYEVPPSADIGAEQCILACEMCRDQIENPEKVNANHWRCLNDSMWSQVPAVQVMAWRMLTRLRHEGWPQDLLDMMYLEGDVKVWAESGMASDTENAVVHQDSNGAVLEIGDTVTLIKDLNVKGGGFTAKRGTAVRNIRLVADNAEHIEGRVSSQLIVILTQFVKKSN